MSWNIFKRLAVLEEKVKDLTDFSGDKSRWLGRLEEKVRQIENKLFMQAVESKAFQEDKEKEKKRLYQREWRAKNKLSFEARERKKAYARAYYARTRGTKK